MSNKHFRDALSDAWETADNFVDEMVEQWRDQGQISDDLHNDYSNGDSYHHESHVDRSYRLTEASEILDELGEWEETDEGLWQGLAPRDAISAQAAYTYGNAVIDLWRRHVVEDLNDKLSTLRETLETETEEAATPTVVNEDEDQDNAEDAAEERILAAGERLIRFVVLIGDHTDEGSDEDKLIAAALSDAEDGETGALTALADWWEEHEQQYRAKGLRRILGLGVN